MYIIVGDPHFGKKHFSLSLFKDQLKIWNEIFKKSKELNAPVISLGDLLDNRISIDIHFFNHLIDEFIGLMKKYDITFYTILGNHDLYFKSTREVNLVKYLSNFYDKFYVIDEVTHFDNLTLVPWIIDKEKDIPKEYNEVVLGHFEFKDIDRYVQGELDLKTFSKAKLVLSGHYHNYSKKDNVIYVGTPYQLDWGDYKEKKGYYILNGTELEFIENNVSKKFIKLKYNESFNKPLIISGYKDEDLFYSIDNIPFEILENNHFKFFINEAKTKNYQKVIYELSKRNLKFEVINNVEMSAILEVDYKPKEIKIENQNILELIPKKYQNLIKEIENFKKEK